MELYLKFFATKLDPKTQSKRKTYENKSFEWLYVLRPLN